MNSVLWPDAQLLSVGVDYDAVVVRIRDSLGATRSVRAEGYIGYSVCGFWDEMIVERAELTESHTAIEQCVRALAQRAATDLDSGNSARNSRTWKTLIVHFIDGSTLEVVAAQFSAD